MNRKFKAVYALTIALLNEEPSKKQQVCLLRCTLGGAKRTLQTDAKVRNRSIYFATSKATLYALSAKKTTVMHSLN